ncbi:hypothetical protein Hypma_003441 [Hypsizygus marmoreus]|uniref:HTH La-type RNA-binding domain-containing protein n=1 Tax=Hypsizygus marmoreus TaxID=39966 RepID=A0A369J9B0_HYPMA|nr:hypothetical protein Hypma_003441 [Hypsizygus marmoreus]
MGIAVVSCIVHGSDAIGKQRTIKFISAEQLMMVQRALLFKDFKITEEVIAIESTDSLLFSLALQIIPARPSASFTSASAFSNSALTIRNASEPNRTIWCPPACILTPTQMASPSISSQPKNPPLSYAERAKKAQNIRSPISLQPPRTVVHSIPSPNGPAAASSSFLPSISAPRSSQDNVDHSLSHSNDTFPSQPLLHSPTALTTDGSSSHSTSSAKRTSNDLAAKALSIVAAHTAPVKSPVVNIWQLRKEQMAAARSVPQQNPSKTPVSQSVAIPVRSTIPTDSTSSKPLPPKTPHDSAPSIPHGPSATAKVNGVTPAQPAVENDPFVVRISAKPARVQMPSVPPPVSDSESWPEVGKSTPASIAPGVAPEPPEGKDGTEAINGSEHDQNHASARKSEKPKWVPIPPEELQATADALAKSPRRQTHPRKGAAPASHQQRSGQNTTQASASPSLQSQSRQHSASQSASHSRVGSRSESLQSSPRFTRARRLPAEETPVVTGASGYGGIRKTEHGRDESVPSANSSPPIINPQLQPQLQPPTPPTQPVAYNDTAQAAGHAPVAYPIPVYSQGEIQAQNGYPQFHTQPQTIPPQPHYFPLGIHPSQASYHSSRGETPPMAQAHTYPLPSTSMGAPPGYPIYALHYPPYEYRPHSHSPQPQPYGYWNNQPGSGHHSPAYPPPPPHQYSPHIPVTYPRHQPQRHHSNPGSAGADALGVMRPPPPEQSSAVAGYHAAATVINTTTSMKEDGEEKPVLFGSIGVPGASSCPSPTPLPASKEQKEGGADEEEGADEKEKEKSFTMFSIGITPGDVGLPRSRSRTHSGKARSRTATMSDGGLLEVKEDAVIDGNVVVKVVDLTDSREAKWEFGTATTATTATNTARGDDARWSHSPSSDRSRDGKWVLEEPEPQPPSSLYEPLPPVLTSLATFGSPPETLPLPPGSSPAELHMRLQQLTLTPPIDSRILDESGDAFKVKDYGYGFGSASRGSASPPEQRNGGEKERSIEAVRDGDKEFGQRDNERRDLEAPLRPRRGGAYFGGYGQERGGQPERGGHERGGHERGAFGGRRGRGMNGVGRGYNRRGGGYQGPPRQPPFNVTPPTTQFQPLMPMGEPNGFYHPLPPRPNLTTYIPTGYEAYLPPPTNPSPSHLTPPHVTPPVPVPVSPISFPLDPTRYYLLGQLEYYLSPQNLAQDFFLRQRMDSRGWVDIKLIASFNRVKQLTGALHLVREVLTLSSVVEVYGEWVRMKGWEQFVLPDAAPSSVERLDHEYTEPHGPLHHQHQSLAAQNGTSITPMGHPMSTGIEGNDVDAHSDIEADEDEDEDVVFVMSHDVGRSGPWSPERHT